MTEAINVGAIIHLRNNAANGGYLDTYGWVAAKPAFWNVAGTERIFVSTYAAADRGGGTTSWQIVSADGKPDGDQLHIGDRVHLRNMYADAGYLDCCGWIEDLTPFNNAAYTGNVRCGVFTSGAPNRDNGTGVWLIQAADKNAGDLLYAGDAIALVNGYPANKQPIDSQHAETGALVAYGALAQNPVFSDFHDRQLLVFTSTNADVRRTNGSWVVTLSPAYTQADPTTSLFDFFRPELLKGRTYAMESVSNMTTVVLLDAFQAVSGMDIEKASQATSATDSLPAAQHAGDTQLLNTLLQARAEHESPNVIDYAFQVKQLWNLFMLSKILKSFDQGILQVLMQQMLTTSQKNGVLPPLDVIRACFQCIAADHTIIQHATMQRRWNKVGGTYYQSTQALELLVMDKLAMKAVMPFQHLLPNLAQQPAIITYFSENTHIHHLPYTDKCILVGVNYDRISPNDMAPAPSATPADGTMLSEDNFASFELMAIPHEVGHYMYQHGTDGGQTFPQISEPFRNTPYYRWCEEIFADVYGCIIAGPLSVFSMQAFLTSGEKKRAWKDDDEHPTPILRPFILSHILRVLSTIDSGYAFSAVADTLDGDWSNTLQKWGYERVDAGTGRPARIYLPDDSSTQLERIINVDRVISTVQPIIATFAKRLLGSRPTPTLALGNRSSGQPASTPIPWKSSASKGQAIDTRQYAREMALLTGAATASEAIPLAVLLDATTSAAGSNDNGADSDTCLRAYVAQWGDNGPATIGPH